MKAPYPRTGTYGVIYALFGNKIYAALRLQKEIFMRGKAPADWGLPDNFNLEGWCIDRMTLNEVETARCRHIMFVAKDTNAVYICTPEDFRDPERAADKSEHDGVKGEKGVGGTNQIILPIIDPRTGKPNYRIREGKRFRVR